MPQSPSLTVFLGPEDQRKLSRLAERTRRPVAVLAAHAITSYVDREIAVLDGIARGLEDMRAGRLVPHDEAMDEIEAAIAAAENMRG